MSGFIIHYNYGSKLVPLRIKSVLQFLWMRLARLWPVHGFILLLFVLLLWIQRANGHVPANPELYRLPDFIKNLLLVHGWSVPLKNSWNVPAWSISCEWLAYLVYPALACFMARMKAPRSTIAAALVILLLTSWVLQQLHADGNTTFGIVRIAGEFPAGCCLCEIYRSGITARLRWTFLLPSAVLAMLIGPFWIFPHFGLVAYWSIPFIAVIILGLSHQKCVISRILSCRPFLFGGYVSYSFYMIHELSIAILQKLAPHLGMAWFPPICLLWVSLCAVLLYFLIEEPSRKGMRRMFFAQPAKAC